MIRIPVKVLLVLASAVAFPLQAAPRLVKDINPAVFPVSRGIGQPVVTAGKTFFSAASREDGLELWSTDRTAAGTRMLKDIYPGLPSSEPAYLKASGTRVFFEADDGVHGRELWISDGTLGGTQLITDLKPGTPSSNPRPAAATASLLWFTAEGPGGSGLWVSDGTSVGTRELNPPVPDVGRPFTNPRLFSMVGATVYFAAGQAEVWKSDGTPEGTVRIENFTAAAGITPSIPSIVVAGTDLYIVASQSNRETLWRTNGGIGAATKIPCRPESDSWLIFHNPIVLGDKLFFSGQTEDQTDTRWRCGDGTLAGSVTFPATMLTLNNHYAVVGSLLYFNDSTTTEGNELWRSDGTLAGTYRLIDIVPGTGSSNPDALIAAGPWLYFTAVTTKNGREIWRSDGTVKGTRMVIETVKSTASTLPEKLTPDGSSIFYLGGQLSAGNDLWHSDGTKPNTRRLTSPANLGVDGTSSYNSAWHVPGARVGTVGSTYLFRANDGKSGAGLWTSNGTTKGTKVLLKAKPGSFYSNLESFTPFLGRSLFVGSLVNQSRQVWITDGIKNGTKQLTRFTVDSLPQDFVVSGAQCFFTVSQTVGQTTTRRLWTTNGTAAGTREVFQANGDPFNVSKGAVHLHGSTLYFFSINAALTCELWRTDGTTAGTVRIKDDFLATHAAQPSAMGNFRQVGPSVCFTTGASSSSALWITDGTTLGTTRVTFDHAPAASINIHRSLSFGDRFLFLASFPNGTNYWWISDGTAAGTKILLNSIVSLGSGHTPGLEDPHAILNGKLYLSIEDLVDGRELWCTDGTPEGTEMVADINEGAGSSYPIDFTLAGDRIFFTADDGENGREIWETDGTPEGTRIAAEIFPGITTGNPSGLAIVGNQLLFSADTLYQGHELYALDLPATSASRIAATTATGTSSTLSLTGPDLLHHAFNLAPGQAATPVLTPGSGTAGYPAFSRTEGFFRVEYLRRKDGLFTYTAKCSSTLAAGSFVPMAGPEMVTEIDDLWQRVIIDHPVPDGTSRMFGIVEVVPK